MNPYDPPKRVLIIGGPLDGEFATPEQEVLRAPMYVPDDSLDIYVRERWSRDRGVQGVLCTEYRLRSLCFRYESMSCIGWAYVWSGVRNPNKAAIMRIIAAMHDKESPDAE